MGSPGPRSGLGVRISLKASDPSPGRGGSAVLRDQRLGLGLGLPLPARSAQSPGAHKGSCVLRPGGAPGEVAGHARGFHATPVVRCVFGPSSGPACPGREGLGEQPSPEQGRDSQALTCLGLPAKAERKPEGRHSCLFLLSFPWESWSAVTPAFAWCSPPPPPCKGPPGGRALRSLPRGLWEQRTCPVLPGWGRGRSDGRGACRLPDS